MSKIYESPDNGKTIYERPFGSNNSEKKLVQTHENDLCVLCGKDSGINKSTHVDFRYHYVEGAGQLCSECYNVAQEREMVCVPKNYFKRYPNNYDLGEKLRSFFYENYNNKNNE